MNKHLDVNKLPGLGIVVTRNRIPCAKICKDAGETFKPLKTDVVADLVVTLTSTAGQYHPFRKKNDSMVLINPNDAKSVWKNPAEFRIPLTIEKKMDKFFVHPLDSKIPVLRLSNTGQSLTLCQTEVIIDKNNMVKIKLTESPEFDIRRINLKVVVPKMQQKSFGLLVGALMKELNLVENLKEITPEEYYGFEFKEQPVNNESENQPEQVTENLQTA